jgi:hydroxyacid-oxoacid transhydrogenase
VRTHVASLIRQVVTDKNLKSTVSVSNALESIDDRKTIRFTVFDDVRVEPTDTSFKTAIRFAQEHGPFDAFVAIGGGSVMDTAKAINLYTTYPPKHFLVRHSPDLPNIQDYVNPTVGKGIPVPGPLKPLICIPTTAGTGSETTGVAIFDYEPLHAKTGIAHRRYVAYLESENSGLKPTLGIVDPDNTATLPPSVAASSGFDVLCHALESYTAIPFDQRPRPEEPLLRPAYQGSNPISDVWSS